jgi:arabinofuranosyltransferase
MTEVGGWSRAFRDDALILAVGAVVLLLFLAAELRIAGETGLPLDDSWIHLRFAENLAAGRGFAINPGVPVAGSTAPLWTLLLAMALACGLPGLLAAKLLGAVAYGATGLLTRRLGLALGLSRGLALAAGLGAVGLGRLAWGALSGMEVPLAAALVAAGLLLAVRGHDLGAAATLGAATLARPEAALLVALHAAAAGRLAAAAARIAVAALVVAPALAFNLGTIGSVLPGTAVAKIEGGLLGRLTGAGDSWAVLGQRAPAYLVEWVGLLAADHLALPVLLVAGGLALRHSRLRVLAFALVFHPLAMALLAPYRGPAFQTGRYSAHLVALEVVVGVAGLGALLGALPPRLGVRPAVVALAGLALAAPLGPASVAYAWGVQNIGAMQVRLGRWVARETPPDALLAVNDVGALTYFGNRRIVDLMGLVTPDIVPARRHGDPGLLAYLERACPDYLVIFPAWFPGLAARSDLFRPIQRVRLEHNVVAGADEMVVYETAWSRRGRPVPACAGRRP